MPLRSRIPAPRARLALALAIALAGCTDPGLPTAAIPPAAPAGPTRAVAPAAAAQATLAVVPGSVTVTRGGGVLLSAVVLDPLNAAQARLPVTWASSNPAVATVSPTGQVRSLGVGAVTITARTTGADLVATSALTVAPPLDCAGRNRRPRSYPLNGATFGETYANTPIMLRIPGDPANPCLRYGFQVIDGAVFGTLYQVAEDGTPRLDARVTNFTRVTNREGWLAYYPKPEFAAFEGAEAIRYAAYDDTWRMVSGLVVGDLRIQRVNVPPVAEEATHPGLNTVRVSDVTLRTSDANQDPLRTCVTELPRNGDLYWIAVDPANRVAVGDCRATRSLKYVSRTAYDLGCTAPPPPSSYPRTDVFRFYATDGRAISDTVVNTIAIAYANLPPVYAGPASVASTEDTPADFAVAATDPEGDAIRYSIVEYPSRGTLYLFDANGDLVRLQGATNLWLSLATPRLRYVPDADFNTLTERDSLLLRVSDAGRVRDCDAAVRFEIAPANDAPVILAPDRVDADETSGTFSVRVRDDARPADVLALTVRAQGPAAGGIDFVDAGGVVVERVSATEVRVSGTLAQLDRLLLGGVQFLTAPNDATEGEVVFILDDRGGFGSGGPRVTTRSVLVDVQRETTGPRRP